MKIFPIVVSLLLLPLVLNANPIVVVSTTDDDGVGSLRQAVVDVNNGGTVTFDSSLDGQVITLTSGLIQVEKEVTVSASELESGLTIDGNANTGVFFLTGNADLSLDGITIQNALWESAITVTAGGRIELQDCAILNSSASSRGGAIYVAGDSTLVMNQCVIEGNSADRGGGIYNYGVMELRGCTFRNNEGREEGGGLYNRGAELIRNCLFVGNTAREEGGAMWLRRDTYLEGCTLHENEAVDGGAIYCSKNLDLDYCTIVNNNALNNYGEFFVAGRLKIFNSIISDNTQVGSATEITETLRSESFFTFFDDGAPLDVLGDYGGPTLTMRPTRGADGLINMGHPSPVILTDSRGVLRKFGEASDIGAVELQEENYEEFLRSPTGDVDSDGVESLLELAMGRDPLSSDPNSPRRLKIDRLGTEATISFGIDPEYADEIALTLWVTKGVEGLEVLLTNEEIRAIPLNDGVLEYELNLDARTKFYRLDAQVISGPLSN